MKVLGILALAAFVVAAAIGLGTQFVGPSDPDECTAICVTPEYTCLGGKRVALDVEVRNATTAAQQLTITATGEIPAVSNPRTYQPGEANNFHFSADGKTTFTINVQSGAGKPMEYTLKPDEACQEGDGLG